jgi:hypothetical protein
VKTKSVGLKRAVRIEIFEACIEAQMNFRRVPDLELTSSLTILISLQVRAI